MSQQVMSVQCWASVKKLEAATLTQQQGSMCVRGSDYPLKATSSENKEHRESCRNPTRTDVCVSALA